MIKSLKRIFPSDTGASESNSKIPFFGPTHPEGSQLNEELLTVCSTCQQVFNPSQISSHLAKCKGTFVCEICKSTFSQKDYLQKHIRRKHKSTEKSHICLDCGKGCSTKNALLVHQRIHSGFLPYQCTICGLKFSQLNNFQIHVDIRHSNGEFKDSTDKHYGCEWCDKSFFYMAGLKYHMKEHFKVIVESEELNFKCDKCDKKFRFKSQLDRHLTSHLSRDEYAHECKICFKKFNQLRLLSAHILYHKDPSLVQCPHCSRSFSSRSYLQKHLYLHNKIESLSIKSTPGKDVDTTFETLLEFNKNLPKLEILDKIQFNENLLMSHLEYQMKADDPSIVKTDNSETVKAIDSILSKESLDLDSIDDELVANLFNQNDNFSGPE